MAGVVFPLALALTATRTVLVVDAVYLAAKGTSLGAVARATQAITASSPQSARRREPSTARPNAGSATRVRILHRRLLCMHFTAMLTMSAGVAKYMLPVSDTSCLVTYRAMISSILLYDASLVLFLLAKTSVTNGNRVLARWEVVITWWSRFYAWVYLPMTAFFLATSLPSVASETGNYCSNNYVEESGRSELVNALGFCSNNAMLIVQFVLLLAMFVKPMRTAQGSTQSGGAVYRRVVIRNVVCTSGITFTYVITTLVVFVALMSDSDENNKADQLADTTPSVNILLTLCLTEIALPLGFSSCIKAVRAHSSPTPSQTKRGPTSGTMMHTKRQACATTEPVSVKQQRSARVVVVPAEENEDSPAQTEVTPFEEATESLA